MRNGKNKVFGDKTDAPSLAKTKGLLAQTQVFAFSPSKGGEKKGSSSVLSDDIGKTEGGMRKEIPIEGDATNSLGVKSDEKR
jgi:hypothetical protein